MADLAQLGIAVNIQDNNADKKLNALSTAADSLTRVVEGLESSVKKASDALSKTGKGASSKLKTQEKATKEITKAYIQLLGMLNKVDKAYSSIGSTNTGTKQLQKDLNEVNKELSKSYNAGKVVGEQYTEIARVVDTLSAKLGSFGKVTENATKKASRGYIQLKGDMNKLQQALNTIGTTSTGLATLKTELKNIEKEFVAMYEAGIMDVKTMTELGLVADKLSAKFREQSATIKALNEGNLKCADAEAKAHNQALKRMDAIKANIDLNKQEMQIRRKEAIAELQKEEQARENELKILKETIIQRTKERDLLESNARKEAVALIRQENDERQKELKTLKDDIIQRAKEKELLESQARQKAVKTLQEEENTRNKILESLKADIIQRTSEKELLESQARQKAIKDLKNEVSERHEHNESLKADIIQRSKEQELLESQARQKAVKFLQEEKTARNEELEILKKDIIQ